MSLPITILLRYQSEIEPLPFNRLILHYLFEFRSSEEAHMTKTLHQPFIWSLKIIKTVKIYLAHQICICLTYILQGYFFSPGVKFTFLYSFNLPMINQKKKKTYKYKTPLSSLLPHTPPDTHLLIYL